MEELKEIHVRVSSKDMERKNYTSLLGYAIAKVNKRAQEIFDEYRFVNVIPITKTDHDIMTDYCELTVFLAVPSRTLFCVHQVSIKGGRTACAIRINDGTVFDCPYTVHPEKCSHYRENQD